MMAGSTGTTETSALLLTMEEVPMGSLVYVCDPHTSMPAEDSDGEKLPPLVKLAGGIPLRAKLYPVDQIHRTSRGSIMANGFDSAKPEVVFTPVEVYATADAPAETEYAVFLPSGRMLHDGRPVRLYKDAAGRFITARLCSAARRWDLPPEAQLVPTCELGKGRDPRF